MKLLTVALYLITSIVCLYWSLLTFLTGMYGISFSWWAIVVFAGSLFLMAGAIFILASARKWSEWTSAIGAIVLAIYFLPAFCVSLLEYVEGKAPHDVESVLDLLMALLVLLVFWIAVGRKIHPKVRKPNRLDLHQ
ncbi:MAG TPA: hypothetical protein VGM11_08995 [Acidobacteriaceae bacterium]